jgi:hypothetical protein
MSKNKIFVLIYHRHKLLVIMYSKEFEMDAIYSKNNPDFNLIN